MLHDISTDATWYVDRARSTCYYCNHMAAHVSWQYPMAAVKFNANPSNKLDVSVIDSQSTLTYRIQLQRDRDELKY